MRKGLCILIVLSGILANLVFLFRENAAEADWHNRIEWEDTTESVFIKDSSTSAAEFAPQVQKISDETGAGIVKTEYPANDEWDIQKYAAFPDGQWPAIPLVSGSLPEGSDDFLASLDTRQPGQTGRIRDMFQDQRIQIQSVQVLADQQGYVDGSWTITGEKQAIQTAKNRLAQAAGVSPDSLSDYRLGVSYGEGPQSVLVLLLGILSAVYALLCLFYPVSCRKEIGVKRLLGYSSFMIWKTMFLSLFAGSLAVLLTVSFLAEWLIADLPFSALLTLLAISCFTVMGALLFSLAVLAAIRRQTISLVIKGQYHARITESVTGLIKFGVSLAIVLTLPTAAQLAAMTFNQYISVQRLHQRGELLVLNSYDYVDDEFQKFLSGDRTVQNKLAAMITELTQTAGAQYIYSYVGRVEDTQLSQSITANKNYMKQFEKILPEPLDTYYESGTLHFLIPETWTSQQQEAYKQQQISAQSDSTSPVLIFDEYDPQTLQIPADNPTLLARGEMYMNEPAIAFATDEWLALGNYILNTGAQSTVRIEDTSASRKAIESAIQTAGLGKNNVTFVPFQETMKIQLQGSLTGMGVVTGMLLLLFSISLLSSYYLQLISLSVNVKELFVKKFLGYSLARRYRGQFSLQAASTICSIIVLWTTHQKAGCWILYGILLCADAAISMCLLIRQEARQMSGMLKGEE